jgi:hypothetical protein
MANTNDHIASLDYAHECYKGYCLDRQGVAPFESLSPTEQERWTNAVSRLLDLLASDTIFNTPVNSKHKETKRDER